MNIRFIGGGAMATAIIAGILKSDAQNDITITVIEPASTARCALHDRFSDAVTVVSSWEDAPDITPDNTRLMVLAVKPQQVKEALQPLTAFTGTLPPLLSIAAGVRVETLSRLLGGFGNIIRAMPNTPALIAAGITGLYAAPNVDVETRALVTKLLSAVGNTVWLDDQTKMDVMTALTGSGPAYVFYFMECLENAALSLGLTPEEARSVALALTESSAGLARHEDRAFAALREQVTSKRGTTESAVCVLDQSDVKGIFGAAIAAAHRRAVELGDELDAMTQ